MVKQTNIKSSKLGENHAVNRTKAYYFFFMKESYKLLRNTKISKIGKSNLIRGNVIHFNSQFRHAPVNKKQ